MLLFIASLCTTAFTLDGGIDDYWPGYMVLFLGWIEGLEGNFGWYANLLLLYVWQLDTKSDHPTKAAAFAIPAMLLALTSFFLKEIPNEVSSKPIASYGPGFWLWLSSFTVTLIGSFAAMSADTPKPKSSQSPAPKKEFDDTFN